MGLNDFLLRITIQSAIFHVEIPSSEDYGFREAKARLLL